MTSRRSILAGLLGLLIPLSKGAALAEAPSATPRPPIRPEDLGKRVDPALAKLIAAAKLTGALSFVVSNRENGRVLEEHDADLLVPPASVTKAVTALFALEHLGPDFRFATRVMRRGPVVEGRLIGDLLLVGGGDPTFDTDKMGDLVAALAARGITSISGKFLVISAALPERFEIAADQPDHLGYNPAISGLMLNFNRVNFVWKAVNNGWQTQMIAEGERFLPQVTMAKVEIVQRDTPLFTYEAGTEAVLDRWTVASTALGEEGGRWLPVRHPAPYAAEVFQALCAAQGLALPKAEFVSVVPDDAEEILRHESEALPDVLRKMLKFSTNLTAEAVGLMASGAGTLEGSAAVMTNWVKRRFGVEALFGDHSGLGPKSRITARAMAEIFRKSGNAKHGTLLQSVLREHGVADNTGREIEENPRRSFAKSGTLNFVTGLAGFITAPNTPDLVFAIFAADIPRRDALAPEDREDPEGGAAWTKRARKLTALLIARWSRAFQ